MIPLSNIKKREQQRQEQQIYLDINCDLGQSYGIYKNDLEFSLLPYVSSVNISCGSHAGDPVTIMNALKAASERSLAIGAHIGYPDIQGFGYRPMQLNNEELEALVVYQIGALSSLAKTYNLVVEHVRPHGALYKQAAEDVNVSTAIAKAIAKFDPWLIYVGAAGANLKQAGEEANIRVAGEIHLDKIYNPDGSIDFNSGNKTDLEYAVSQLESIIKNSSIANNQGGKTKIDANTIHLNINTEISIEIAKKAKELVPNPIPIAATLISDTGWIQ